MNFVRLDDRWLNLDLVILIEAVPGPERRLSATHILGGAVELAGGEADQLRGFLATHGRSLGSPSDAGESRDPNWGADVGDEGDNPLRSQSPDG